MTRHKFRILMIPTVVPGFLGGTYTPNALQRYALALTRATGGKVQDVVTAWKFALVDDANKTRALVTLLASTPGSGQADAAIDALPDGSPSLTLHDPAAKLEVSGLVQDGLPSLTLFEAGRQNPLRALLGMFVPSWAGYVEVMLRAGIGVFVHPRIGSIPFVALTDASGETQWRYGYAGAARANAATVPPRVGKPVMALAAQINWHYEWRRGEPEGHYIHEEFEGFAERPPPDQH